MALQVLSLLFLAVTTLPLLTSSQFTLTLLHTNDHHAHLAPFNKYGSECSQEDTLEEGRCFGGVARVHRTVQDVRRRGDATLLVDAGDQAQGTLWYEVHRFNITAHFMNKMGYDVMCAGNHEFDYGQQAFMAFANSLSFPLLSANLDSSGVPGASVPRSTVVRVGAERIGVIGYTTTDTTFISFPEGFKFTPIIAALRREVAVLQNMGIDKIMALGHAGYDIDLQVAKEVAGLDVVVGGHSNTFLYTGPAPDREEPEGEYPTVVKQPSGRRVLVVQAYQFIKYLGFLRVTFDDDGEVLSWEGNPILLNSSFPEDDGVKQDLETWRQPLVEVQQTTVGSTRVVLDSSKCRYEECNIGTLLGEAIVERFNKNPPAGSWASVSIALVNGGGVRATIDPGQMNLADIFNIHPFGNMIDIVSLRGEHIKTILEHCIRTQYGQGGFLQFAGLRVLYHYNVQQPKESEVVEVKVRCAQCPFPVYKDLDESKVYRVAVNNFLIGGGDSYTIKPYILNKTVAGELMTEMLSKYISENTPIVQGLDGRIRVVNITSMTTSTPNTRQSPPCLQNSGLSPRVNNIALVLCLMVVICLKWKS